MTIIKQLQQKVLSNSSISKDEAMTLLDSDLDELCLAANELRQNFCSNRFDICVIINGKSGKCSENCKFCAQSSHHQVPLEIYPLLTTDNILKDALYNWQKGILRYSVVTSGKRLSNQEVEIICNTYQQIKSACSISLCASHGLLSFEQFLQLKNAGVTRYHNNLETSRAYFPQICTTHTYDDKLTAIDHARKAGLEICSGGIIGLGESREDRIDMALTLRDLEITSVPINIFSPITGTPFAALPLLSTDEVRRTTAIFRFILPSAAIRLAGGRGLMPDKGKSAFASGANAAISGDMLTTSGISINEDMAIINELGYQVSSL